MRVAAACLLAACLSIAANYGPAAADEPAKPKIVSALDLKRGDAVIYGLLREPLGTVQVISGTCIEPRNHERVDNPLLVTASGNVAWGAGVSIEIRGITLEKDKHYRFEGYE